MIMYIAGQVGSRSKLLSGKLEDLIAYIEILERVGSRDEAVFLGDALGMHLDRKLDKFQNIRFSQNRQ